MFFQQVYDKSLAQASYIIGCQVNGEAIVIDAKRDVDTYLEIAKQNNLRITKLVETHIHADFLSGTRELAAITGATMYLSDEGGADWQYQFPHHGLKHGDVITLGNLTFEILHTPGHTPESISLLLIDHPATTHPVMIFTGDFVFVGDVGRPDLLEVAAGIAGTKEWGAAQMYASLQRFVNLPGFVQVWPGHGAGSSCGKALGAVPNSTVGYEKLRNWALEESSEVDFVKRLLDGQPAAPTYFKEMKMRNKGERPLLLEVPAIPKLSLEEFETYQKQDAQIVDVRNKLEFAAAHVPKTLNIQLNNSFATWSGWMLNYEQPIVLIITESKLEDALRKLMRIGMDHVAGFIEPSEIASLATAKTEVVDKAQLKQLIDTEPNLQLLDVRNADEYKKGHIDGAQHVFVGTMSKQLTQISKERPIALYCQSGDRAAIASSFLQAKGFTNLKVYFGGMNDWTKTAE
ncbi:MBL fold metallo-hydrolase [Sphingobacterium corticibacter]|uniref:MBL fold metallo-hydrolase n=1 Tax=Sphingobacterium corticibacter TaxID=2171749 RepID=A0A2T8HHT2_9SPHI|nr:MBL fold metallo-hydrolase [Sphingobacterium corticibacter]PVH24991.1 MBL fold metallo-hydrolase [Sphingobacterium corticibacter]